MLSFNYIVFFQLKLYCIRISEIPHTLMTRSTKTSLLFLLLGLALCGLTSCQSENPDFCKRHALDQLNDYVPEPNGLSKYDQRIVHIKSNFELLKKLSFNKQLRDHVNEDCFQRFVEVTLIHYAQNFPNEFFEKKFINQMKIYKDDNTIKSASFGTTMGIVRDASSFPLCQKLKQNIDYALDQWNIIEDELNPASSEDYNYVSCE